MLYTRLLSLTAGARVMLGVIGGILVPLFGQVLRLVSIFVGESTLVAGMVPVTKIGLSTDPRFTPYWARLFM